MPTVTTIAAHLIWWCRIAVVFLDEVEVLGVDVLPRHVHIAKCIFHRVLQGAGTADEVLQGTLVGRKPATQSVGADVSSLAGPITLRV